MIETNALIKREAQDPIAWLSEPLESLGLGCGVITAGTFLYHVRTLAESLPASSDYPYTINLCRNRYLFMVGFCATIVRGQTNLLPSNKNPLTQTVLQKRYQGAPIIHDGEVELVDGPNINIKELSFDRDLQVSPSFDVPQIDLQHIAAICFTSGSTGDAKAIVKTWQTFVESTAINSRYMLPNQEDLFYHLATVHSQHMWGLETMVLMSLMSSVCMVDAQPFYPVEIFSILDRLPKPRALVTTPLHLRAINASNIHSVEVHNTLVATAPLTSELAQAIEAKLSTKVREVYGCSEVGSMAVRETAQSDHWQRFEGISFETTIDGQTIVSAKHLTDSCPLDDSISLLKDNYFLLAGRNSDQINIAGKRGSLVEVNNVLMKFQGLIDGAVIFPPQDRPVPRLVAVVVLAQASNKAELRKHFSRYLDAAFVPRPILVVDALPREESGKLSKSRLLELYHSLIAN